MDYNLPKVTNTNFTYTTDTSNSTKVSMIKYMIGDVKYNISLNNAVSVKFSGLFNLARKRQIYNVNLGLIRKDGTTDVYRYHFSKASIFEDDNKMYIAMLSRIKSLPTSCKLTYSSTPILVGKDNRTFPCNYVII